MNELTLILLFLAAVSGAHANSAPKPPAAAPLPITSQLQNVCVNKVHLTLKKGERIRDISTAPGKFEKDVLFKIAVGAKVQRVVACQVKQDGSLNFVNRAP